MPPASPPQVAPSFDLKSASLTLISFVLQTTSLAELTAALDARFEATPGLFEQDPVVIDLTPLREATERIDFVKLLKLLRKRKMVPVAVKGGNAEQMAAALDAGLAEAPESSQPASRPEPAPAPVAAAPAPEPEPAPEPTPEPAAVATVVVDRPLRSGQQVYARGADLVVMAAVSFGAEVIADGNIHVYAPLRGRAVAGAKGNTAARIFTTCLEAQLISIAGTYRTTDTGLPDEVRGKPAQVRLDGETLVIEPLPN